MKKCTINDWDKFHRPIWSSRNKIDKIKEKDLAFCLNELDNDG